MAGLRERKKEETRQRITAAAWRLFVERGFEAVTVNEIAEAAQVAKATLFAYFPTKESLALLGVGDEDLAGIVSGRASGQSPLRALRAHYRAFVSGGGADPTGSKTAEGAEGARSVGGAGGTGGGAEPSQAGPYAPGRAEMLARVRVVVDSPALSAAANALRYEQRRALAEVLTPELGPTRAALTAAQIAASLLTLQESYFRRLLEGSSPGDAGRALADDLELAFDLLEHGLAAGKGSGHDGR